MTLVLFRPTCLKTFVCSDARSPVLPAALFTVAEMREQPVSSDGDDVVRTDHGQRLSRKEEMLPSVTTRQIWRGLSRIFITAKNKEDNVSTSRMFKFVRKSYNFYVFPP